VKRQARKKSCNDLWLDFLATQVETLATIFREKIPQQQKTLEQKVFAEKFCVQKILSGEICG
jgi:hypothetical protein